MEESKQKSILNTEQNHALFEAWELSTFIEGVVKFQLETVGEHTTPFLNGLYMNILEIKKRLDVATTPN